jgi:nucleotide-binding universal stress UspA family protein
MDPLEFFGPMSDERWPDGPIVLGVGWEVSERLARTAAGLAAGLGLHLVCAFVDPASYLTEWGPGGSRTASSLDPAPSEEAHFPSGEVLQSLAAILGPPGAEWSFRVLNGDVAQALGRLADSAGAALLIVGGPRAGVLARIDRLLEGSVSASLTCTQNRPVLIVPDSA